MCQLLTIALSWIWILRIDWHDFCHELNIEHRFGNRCLFMISCNAQLKYLCHYFYIPANDSSDGAKVVYESKDGKTSKTLDAMDWLAQLTTNTISWIFSFPKKCRLDLPISNFHKYHELMLTIPIRNQLDKESGAKNRFNPGFSLYPCKWSIHRMASTSLISPR